jgi:hypothetical protein
LDLGLRWGRKEGWIRHSPSSTKSSGIELEHTRVWERGREAES